MAVLVMMELFTMLTAQISEAAQAVDVILLHSAGKTCGLVLSSPTMPAGLQCIADDSSTDEGNDDDPRSVPRTISKSPFGAWPNQPINQQHPPVSQPASQPA